MKDRLHRTDTVLAHKDVTCGPQIKHWIEFQLLDEQGEPLVNIPFRATNEATCTNHVPEYTGQSDAEGVIRIEGLHPLAITLLMQADPLAEELQNRRLRAVRAEPRRPGFGDRTPLYGPQRSGFSPIEQQANAAGHLYHYLRIGQLCDGRPTFNPPLDSPGLLPPYHFPDPECGGFTLSPDGLNRRHVLEICPFRAWSLVLHHQAEYSLANAYNLGLMSILSYSTSPHGERGSVNEFFEQQCLDLSRTPQVWGDGKPQPCLVRDLPFNDRYATAKSLDTKEAQPPEGDTQLFYAISTSQVLIAWRGTEMGWPFSDLITDLTFRPVKPGIQTGCEPKVPCADLTPEGLVHLGFRDAFDVANRVYGKDLGKEFSEIIQGKKLFICGHSLGGALGLIHAASLKIHNPLLYTYGMPRTFTLKAMQGLSEIWHYRHVNDTDTIPSVPPEAELDNYLYDLYGPLGATMGFAWSMLQLVSSPLFKHEDPFCHHGQIAAFYQLEQHTEERGSSFPAYRSKDGLGAPYYNTIATRLPEKAKLYVVPCLSEEADKQVKDDQQRFNASLTPQSRAKFFPAYGNVKPGRLSGLVNHFMSEYQPYLYKQLLEAIEPVRDPLLELQAQRQKFKEQMTANSQRIPKDQYAISRVLLDLQSQLSDTLHVTQQTEGGIQALQRFNAVADPDITYAKTYG